MDISTHFQVNILLYELAKAANSALDIAFKVT